MRDRFRVQPGTEVDLSAYDPAATPGCDSKRAAKERSKKLLEKLDDLQYLLYAENKRAVLMVLQAMDTGGKSGTVRHVLSGVNPMGVKISAFKKPTPEELDHDYLWRIHKAVPGKGEIGVFDRSHYEDVLVVRVLGLVPEEVWQPRYEQINEFERLLASNGVIILKFFLHISKDEQLERLRARMDDPRRHWKISPTDFEARRRWGDYMRAYEAALSRCSTDWAPWYVVPADRKWYRNLVVSEILVQTLEEQGMAFPEPQVDLSRITLE